MSQGTAGKSSSCFGAGCRTIAWLHAYHVYNNWSEEYTSLIVKTTVYIYYTGLLLLTYSRRYESYVESLTTCLIDTIGSINSGFPISNISDVYNYMYTCEPN